MLAPCIVMLLSIALTLTAPWPFSICIFGIINGSIGGTVSSSMPKEQKLHWHNYILLFIAKPRLIKRLTRVLKTMSLCWRNSVIENSHSLHIHLGWFVISVDNAHSVIVLRTNLFKIQILMIFYGFTLFLFSYIGAIYFY